MRWTGNFTVHFAFETAGYLAAIIIYVVQRGHHGDNVTDETRASVLAGAVCPAFKATSATAISSAC